MLPSSARPLLPIVSAVALLVLGGCPSAVESSAPVAEDDGKADDTGDDADDTDDTDDDDDTADDTTPFRIVIMSAAALTVAVGGEIEVSIFAEDSNGDVLTGAGDATLVSSETDVATTAIDGAMGGTTSATISGEAPGTAVLTATLAGLTATKNITVTGEEEEEEDEVDWDHCCALATHGPDDKNMCYIPPDEPGCPMTADDGYCDKDGDNNYSTPDASYPACESNGDGCNSDGWEQGWLEADQHC